MRIAGFCAGLIIVAKLVLSPVTGFALQTPVITSLVLSNKYPSPPLTTNNVPVVTNGLVTLHWRGDTNAKFDLLYSTSITSNTGWNIAQSNIGADPTGSNTLSDPPYLASSAYSANTNLFYEVNEMPASSPALGIKFQTLVSNLVLPTVLTHAHDGSGRRFIADQPGQIRIVDSSGTVLPTPFLDISSRMVSLSPNYDERGLLGLAFHPGYSTNGRFFVFYSAPTTDANDDAAILAEFKVSSTNANVADASSQRILLSVEKPDFNHNGGCVSFGQDGYLYVSYGDGGGEADEHGTYGNAQNLSTVLGKLIRINVDSGSPYGIPSDNPFVSTPGARPEIYALGLRNPFRFSFDRGGTHQGFLADVGQEVWEEVNLIRKGGNYGWRMMEGNHAFDPTIAPGLGVSIPSLDFPIYEYGHGASGLCVIGGFVYRGSAYPQLVGKYVFGDWSATFYNPTGQLYYLDETRPGIWERFSFQLPNGSALGYYINSFGEDEAGEIYLLGTKQRGPTGNTGTVLRLLPP